MQVSELRLCGHDEVGNEMMKKCTNGTKGRKNATLRYEELKHAMATTTTTTTATTTTGQNLLDNSKRNETKKPSIAPNPRNYS